MKNWLFIMTFILVPFCGMGNGARPNVLIIIIDDLRPDLGCYGNNQIISTNIDNLAKDGFLFNRAYVQQAVCSASRASFLTGFRPTTTGVDYPYNPYFNNEFWPNNPTISEHFEQEGYDVFTLGKVHHSNRQDNIKNTHYSAENLGFYALQENIDKAGDQKRNEFTPHFERAQVSDTAYQDGLIAKRVTEVIDDMKGSDEPFLIIAGFKKPHLPFNAPEKYWRLYDSVDIQLASVSSHPLYAPSYTTAHHELSLYAGPNTLNGNNIPDDYQLKLKQGYYACISYVDAMVGQVLDKLKESGEYENTLIVLMSDHGFHLGDQGMWGKSTNYEIATRSPLIVKLPGNKGGISLNQFVEYVDIYPTLVDFIGNEPRKELEGTSFNNLFNDINKEWKSAVFSQFNRGRDFEGYSIRTEDYRYVEWRNLKDHKFISRELYDMKIENSESINVVNDPKYASIRNDLAIRLKQGWKAALPPGVENNSDNEPAPSSLPWGSWDLVEEDCNELFKIYSNPTNGEVSINIIGGGSNKVSIYDALGNLQLTGYTIDSQQKLIDISRLPSGLYIVKVGTCTSRLVIN